MWVKKCIEMREMLFKNLKWLFENTNQTPPKSFMSLDISLVQLIFFYSLW